MIRDRLNSLLKKRQFAQSIEKIAHQHGPQTLLNQKQIVCDLAQFAEIIRWIAELLRNVDEIERAFSDDASIGSSQMLSDTATLCHKIFNSVKRMQAELEKINQQKSGETRESSGVDGDEGTDLVSLVWSSQLESAKSAYFDAFWKFQTLVRNYEQKMEECKRVVSSQTNISRSQCDISQPTICNVDTSDQQSSRRHSLEDQKGFQKTDTIDKAAASETLQAVEGRYQDLQSLERTMLEMRDLFVLFSTLVMEHGSMLNLAETKVEDAAQHVAVAAEDIKEAYHYYRKAGGGKWLCIDVSRCLLVLLAFLVVIAVFLAIKKYLI
ncbi:syntaxin-1A-like [Armigeres subalbatus]|uniref:syntaxin-1A-like n=1 Tax=Armigeres subalbatus TaxID=124917 RepID=UPI002ED1E891